MSAAAAAMQHGNYSELVIHFGKHKGRTVEDLPSSYLKWVEGIDRKSQADRELVRAAYLELAWRDRHDAHFED